MLYTSEKVCKRIKKCLKLITMSYYKYINSIRMDAKLLDQAEQLKDAVDNPVELNKVLKNLLDGVRDGGKVTLTEFNTLLYINEHYLGKRDTILKSVIEILTIILPPVHEEKEMWSYDRA